MGYGHRNHDIENPPVQKYINPYNHRRSPCEKFRRAAYCIIILIVLLFLFVFFTFLFFFTVLSPQFPVYSISSLKVSSIKVNPVNPAVTSDLTLYMDARNPNKRISIQYRPGGKVSLIYRDAILGTGEVQEFIQHGMNTTTFGVRLKGTSLVQPGVRAALMESIAGQAKPGEVMGLILKIMLPVTIRFDNLVAIGKYRIYVTCNLDVDGLQPGRDARITSPSYQFNVDYFHFSKG